MKYHYEVYDNVIDQNLQKEVWEYMMNQTFSAARRDVNYLDVPNKGTIIYYVPSEGKKEYLDSTLPGVNSQFMHRTVFGNNEQEIKEHPPIAKLWDSIHKVIGGDWSIAGDPEGVANRRLNTNLWRVYVNAQPEETIKRSHGVHRDTIDLKDDQNYTLLYIANPEWYPTWFGENIFYEDDDNSIDTQQYQKGYGQSRNFKVGDPFAVVSPKPGRIILYDGRMLHTTRPVSIWAKEMRYAVVFRIRKNKIIL
jgi:hypothetical protein